MAGITEESAKMDYGNGTMYQIMSAIDSVIRPLIPMFLEQSILRIHGLDEAWQKSDFATIKKLAHTIKGSASSYGFNMMADVARDIEDIIRADDIDVEKLKQRVDNLYLIYEAALVVVREHPEMFHES